MAGQPPPANPGRPAAPATKTARQAQIVAILSREQVHSQERLAGLLAQYAGLHVAQATLSRDLDELGVVRRIAHLEPHELIPAVGERH